MLTMSNLSSPLLSSLPDSSDHDEEVARASSQQPEGVLYSQDIDHTKVENEASNSTLFQALSVQAPEVVHFLRASGILSTWLLLRRNQVQRALTCREVWYDIAYALNLLSMPYFLIVSVIYFLTNNYGSMKVMFEYGVIIDSLLFLQIVVLIPFLYQSVRHLLIATPHNKDSNGKSQHHFFQFVRSAEVQAFQDLMPMCYVFFAVFLVMLVIDFIVKFKLSTENLLRVNLLEYVSICAITASLLFVSADCRVCYAIADRLLQQVKSGVSQMPLNMAQLKQSRQEVDDRVQRHAYTISWIVLVAVLNILYLLVVDIISTKWTAKELLELLPWKLASYFKEIAFLMVLFNESAKLNEKADELMHNIANHELPGDEDRFSVVAPEGVAEQEMMRQQVRRLTLVNALATKPISFPIAGRRWTKMDMLLQVMTVVATSLIVIVRAIVLGNTT